MINFYIGEEKYVDANIVSKNKLDTIVVNEATYELSSTDGTVIDSGNPTIDGTKLTMLIKPPSTGVYKLKITVKVGPETIIEQANIQVKP